MSALVEGMTTGGQIGEKCDCPLTAGASDQPGELHTAVVAAHSLKHVQTNEPDAVIAG